MTDSTRTQGWAICIGSGLLALLFVSGILSGSYWAIALPVAVLTLFVLGLAGWVGYTIATIQVEADPAPEVLSTETPSAASPSGHATTPSGHAATPSGHAAAGDASEVA